MWSQHRSHDSGGVRSRSKVKNRRARAHPFHAWLNLPKYQRNQGCAWKPWGCFLTCNSGISATAKEIRITLAKNTQKIQRKTSHPRGRRYRSRTNQASRHIQGDKGSCSSTYTRRWCLLKWDFWNSQHFILRLNKRTLSITFLCHINLRAISRIKIHQHTLSWLGNIYEGCKR